MSIKNEAKLKNPLLVFYGLEKCQEMVDTLTEEAVQAVTLAFPESSFLQNLAYWLAKRDH